MHTMMHPHPNHGLTLCKNLLSTTLTVNTAKTRNSTPANLAKKLTTLAKGRPLKSELGIGHPASILSDKRKQVYFANGDGTADYQGVYNVNFRRWLTYDDNDVSIATREDDSSHVQVHYRVSAYHLLDAVTP